MESKYEFAAGKETPPQRGEATTMGARLSSGAVLWLGGKFYLLLEGFE